jgi:ribosome-associated toxin RatA of RatAB toxin-antitoxin module
VKHIHKTAVVPYPVQDIFALVSNITEYPKFLPWCKAVTVLSQTETGIIANIAMGNIGLEKSFTTQNLIKPNEWIEMRLVEGPFSHLQGYWHFRPLGDKGCKIALSMEFEISNKLLRLALEPVFTMIANSLVDAFVKRAKEVYGKS